MRRLLVASLAIILTGAALPPTAISSRDVLREEIIASASVLTPGKLAFERTTRLERKGGGSLLRQVRSERWDGATWTLMSVDGKSPSERERRASQLRQSTEDVPGYHQLARIMAAAQDRRIDENGHTVLILPVLPPRTVMADGKDISAHLKGEALLGSKAGRPWVERLTVTEREPFKLNFLIKVTSFEQVNNYRISADGEPRLVAQRNDSAGSMFGISGGEKSEVLYAYR